MKHCVTQIGAFFVYWFMSSDKYVIECLFKTFWTGLMFLKPSPSPFVIYLRQFGWLVWTFSIRYMGPSVLERTIIIEKGSIYIAHFQIRKNEECVSRDIATWKDKKNAGMLLYQFRWAHTRINETSLRPSLHFSLYICFNIYFVCTLFIKNKDPCARSRRENTCTISAKGIWYIKFINFYFKLS